MINNSFASPLWAIHPNYAVNIHNAYNKQINFYSEQSKEKFDCNLDINNKTHIPETFTIQDSMAILPISGTVIPKSDFFTVYFGGFAALDIIERDFKELLSRDNIETILLDIDSPGGNAFGVEQFANLVFESRDKKQIISVTSGMMASAAMWIGAAASKVFITGEVTITGSIGTVTTHTDISGLNKQIGITQTEISAGKFKRIPSSLAPLDEKGRKVLQGQVDQVNSAFINNIARFKNIQPREVLKMADGKTFIGSQAIKVGLIDGLLTMEQLLSSINSDTGVIKTTKDNNFNSLIGGQKMTLIEQISQMKTENVDLYNAMIEKGKIEAKTEMEESLTDVKAVEYAKGIEAGKTTGRDEGILAERSRISDLQALSNSANKDMVDGFIADGKTTAPEAAVEILKAQNVSNKSKLDAIANNSPEPVSAETGTDSQKNESEKGLKALVVDYMKEHNCSKGAAIIACSKEYPDAVNDFVEIVKRKNR